jgi:hypothetical protein
MKLCLFAKALGSPLFVYFEVYGFLRTTSLKWNLTNLLYDKQTVSTSEAMHKLP